MGISKGLVAETIMAGWILVSAEAQKICEGFEEMTPDHDRKFLPHMSLVGSEVGIFVTCGSLR